MLKITITPILFALLTSSARFHRVLQLDRLFFPINWCKALLLSLIPLTVQHFDFLFILNVSEAHHVNVFFQQAPIRNFSVEKEAKFQVTRSLSGFILV